MGRGNANENDTPPFLRAPQILRFGVLLYFVLQSKGAKADDWTTYQHDAAHTGRSTADFDPTTLKRVWGSSSKNTQPIVVGNTLYDLTKSEDPLNPVALISYNLATGQKNWSTNFKAGGAAGWAGVSHLTFADGLLLFAGQNGIVDHKLYAWDAATGTQRYVVDLPDIEYFSLTATVARNANNQLVAYVAGGNTIAAVALGASSGNVLWTSYGAALGGSSIPTVVGESVILTGPGDYYAFDQLTGASNHFYGTGGSGGGGVTVAYDSLRKQFYVRDHENLTAYSYTSQTSISQVWQMPANVNGGSVAIGADGGIYFTDSTSLHSLFERDPTDVHLVKSISMAAEYSFGATPTLSANSLFICDSEVVGQTKVYDLNTLALVRTLPKGRPGSNSAYQGSGAIFDNGYVLYHSEGFDVYWAVPEPSTLILAVGIFSQLAICRRLHINC